MSGVLVGFYLIFPSVIIWLCYRFAVFNKIGAVILCYLTGIILGNCGILSDPSVAGIQNSLSGATVALALPLLLFSMDVRSWVKLAGKAILSMLGATIIIVAVASLGSWFLKDHVTDAWKLGGMAISVYTGGTPNMAAIKTALSVDPSTFIIMHTYDALISMIYVLFAVSVAQRIFNRFLPRFESKDVWMESTNPGSEDISAYGDMFTRKIMIKLLGASLLAILILGVSVGMAGLFPKAYETSIIILLITSLGIAASFVNRVRTIEKTFQLGMYIILIFCIVVGSMANIKDLIHINWAIMSFVVFCIFGSLILHAVFCYLFRIDTDTYIITSVSAICSPPFVPVVAAALKNRQVLLSGLTTGIIGYAIGNYLGITFAYILKAALG